MGSPQVQKVKKPLAPHEFLETTREEALSIITSRVSRQSESLACPYDRCGRRFEQPIVLTDLSRTPRETYYACPYCFSKLEIALESQEKLSSVSVKASDNANVTSPPRCPNYFGYLKTLQREDSVPDMCLTCSKLIQCTVKK